MLFDYVPSPTRWNKWISRLFYFCLETRNRTFPHRKNIYTYYYKFLKKEIFVTVTTKTILVILQNCKRVLNSIKKSKSITKTLMPFLTA